VPVRGVMTFPERWKLPPGKRRRQEYPYSLGNFFFSGRLLFFHPGLQVYDFLVNGIDSIHSQAFPYLHKQRSIERLASCKTLITKKILHVDIFRYLIYRFPVVRIAQVLDDERT
jgi:hypothetical protein